VPRDGSASSSPTILKLCSRPLSLRRLTVMPKDAVLLSAGGLTTSALAPRPPITDFPQSGCGGFPIAFVYGGTVR
jgi:hypothetical protein